MIRGGYGNHWDDPSGISALTGEQAYRRRRKRRNC